MARGVARRSGTTKAAKAKKALQIGEFWLGHRSDTQEWCICWNDPTVGYRRRKGTGCFGSEEDGYPVEAEEALAAHYAQSRGATVAAEEPADARLSPIMTLWIQKEASKLARAPAYGYAVQHLERFFESEERAGLIAGPTTIAHITKDRIERYIRDRKDEGIKGETIHGELTALRRALTWAEGEGYITTVPKVPQVEKKDRSKPKSVEYSIDQVAGLLEAAWRRGDRHHVHLFTMIMLSTHGRTEATLELESHQIRNGRIHFNDDDRDQTTKVRTIVPICATLAPWLADVDGKVIRYRAMLAERKWADPKVPEYFERDCYDIKNAFEACLIEAGTRHPTLGLCRPKLDDGGNQVIRTMASGEQRPVWEGIGSPNTLRHTVHTYLQTVGVPQAQIDTAAGHNTEKGSGRNYTHLRPEYLKDFIAAVEAYWAEMLRYTKVHVRSELGPRVLYFDAGRKKAVGETA